MLNIVIISILSSIFMQNGVNAIIDCPDWICGRDSPDPPSVPKPPFVTQPPNYVDNFKNKLKVFEDIVKTIPDLPNIFELKAFTDCAIAAGKSIINPGSTAIKEATVGINNKLTQIKECKSAMIDSIRSILSNNNKNAYLDLAKAYFNKCSGLNAGAITIELGSGGNAVGGGSQARGLAIDTTNGNVYAYLALCAGFTSDITVNGGSTLSLFTKYSDVAGCSKYYAVGFDVNVLGVEGGMDAMVVYNLPTESIIARGIGYGVGLGLNPSSVDNGYCYTFTPIKMVDLNKFKDNDIIETIPALSNYTPKTQILHDGNSIRFVCHYDPNKGNKYVSHIGNALRCGDTTVQPDAFTFTIRNGLNGKSGHFSFESKDSPRNYIRHAGKLFKLDPYEDHGIYKQDASFIPYYGLNNKTQQLSFESSTDGYRYNFMRAGSDGSIWLDVWQNKTDYKEDTSFLIFPKFN